MRSTSRASCSFPTAATTRQAPPAAAIRGALREVPPNLLDVVVCGDSAEAGIDTALRRHGTPNTIAATPFVPLPKVSGEADEDGAPGEEALTGRLSPEGFRDVVQDNLTHLFRIARKASLINGCQLVLCSPEVPRGATRTTSASPRPTSARPRWTSSLPRWRRLRRPARAVQSRAGSRADLQRQQQLPDRRRARRHKFVGRPAAQGPPLGATGVARWFALTDQLRGNAGARQVEGANIPLQPNLALAEACVVTHFETRWSPARRTDGRHARLVESGAPCAAQPRDFYGG